MADSEIQIANYALSLLGKQRINAFDEDLDAARTVDAVFDLIRDACLVEHEWSFAVSRETLGQLSDGPEFDWEFQFSLPLDCLRVISTDLVDGSIWQIEGRNLVANAENVKIKYVARVTDPTKFCAMFTKYFATRLAEELAFPLTGSRTLEADLYARAEKIKMNAFGIDSVEGTPDQPRNEDWRVQRYTD